MLKKGVDFSMAWGGEQDRAVADIKQALTTAPALRQPDPNKPFVGLVDGSTIGVGDAPSGEEQSGVGIRIDSAG